MYAQWRHCDHDRSRPSSRSKKGCHSQARPLADMPDVSARVWFKTREECIQPPSPDYLYSPTDERRVGRDGRAPGPRAKGPGRCPGRICPRQQG